MDETKRKEFREQYEKGDRLDEATKTDGLEDALLQALDDLDNNYLNTRDDTFAALLDVVDDRPELRADLAERLADAAGREVPENINQSALIRLMFRAALKQAHPKLLEAVEGAKLRQMQREL